MFKITRLIVQIIFILNALYVNSYSFHQISTVSPIINSTIENDMQNPVFKETKSADHKPLNQSICSDMISNRSKAIDNWFHFDSNISLGKRLFLSLAFIFALSLVLIIIISAWNHQLQKRVDFKTALITQQLQDKIKTEKDLAESEKKYRFLFDESPAGNLIVDTEGIIKDLNHTFCKNLGYELSDVVGKSVFDFVAPERHAHIKNIMADRFSGNSVSDEIDTWVLARDGSIRYINFASEQAILYSDNNTVKEILISGIDVTERRKAEDYAKKQHEHILQAEKMVTLGILSSGIAHEINNPNNYILLNSNNLFDIWKDLKLILEKQMDHTGDLMVAGLPYSEIHTEIEPLIEGITDGSQRIRSIVQSLKDFARKDQGEMDQDVNINSVITASEIILKNLIKNSTNNFKLTLVDELPSIIGNFQQIEQVIINLITNACQALTSREQSIEIATCFDAQCQQVVCTVTDQGSGISPEHIQHVFDPFFTTKRTSGGTGLGLSISYSLTKKHNGELILTSTPEKGTTAKLAFPLRSNLSSS